MRMTSISEFYDRVQMTFEDEEVKQEDIECECGMCHAQISFDEHEAYGGVCGKCDKLLHEQIEEQIGGW